MTLELWKKAVDDEIAKIISLTPDGQALPTLLMLFQLQKYLGKMDDKPHAYENDGEKTSHDDKLNHAPTIDEVGAALGEVAKNSVYTNQDRERVDSMRTWADIILPMNDR